LRPEDFAAWDGRQQARAGEATGAGMGFIANDGVRTVVVVALPEQAMRDELLHTICHEICETTTANDDAPFTEDLHEAMSRVLWSEHVAERRRALRFTELGWTGRILDDGHLVEMLADYTLEWPMLRQRARWENRAPHRIYGLWQLLTREFVCTLARARGGVVPERDQVARFIADQNAELAEAWRSIERLLDEIFEHPELSRRDCDQLARDQGWLPLFEVFRGEWNRA
jgi:hypothetical protein